MLRMIQAITEVDPYQAIPAISYKRKQLCAPRENTAQYNRYMLRPVRILQTKKHRNFIQIQLATWTPESLDRRLVRLRSETFQGPAREYTP